MYGALLALALAASANADTLSANDLNQAIDKAHQGAPPALNGQRFHLSLPVLNERSRSLRSFQSPAHWRYKPGDQTLEILIGLGQISAQNYDQYAAQGLAALPPLQTLYFMTDERHRPLMFTTQEEDLTTKQDLGEGRNAVSYGLAVPYGEGGTPSGLPKGFLPLMVYRTKVEARFVNPVVDGMTLEVEGEITTLGDKPNVLCGDFAGGVTMSDVTGKTPVWIKDKQCFVTARINSAIIQNRAGETLARWGDVGR